MASTWILGCLVKIQSENSECGNETYVFKGKAASNLYQQLSEIGAKATLHKDGSFSITEAELIKLGENPLITQSLYQRVKIAAAKSDLGQAMR